MTRCLKFLMVAMMSMAMAGLCSADDLYEADFSTFADGDLNGQDGWDTQPNWQVSGGIAQGTGSWQRAKQTTGFNMAAGDVVRMTVEFSLSGTPGTGNELARFGFAKDNESPGQNTPQVFAAVTWDGNNLSVGGATDTAYDAGDVIQAALTFTRNASANSWSATSRCMNMTDGTSFEAGFAPVDSAGGMTTETAWEWMDLGNNCQFSMRTFDNSSDATLSVNSMLNENNLPPDTPIAEVIYEADFATFNTDFLANQDGWEAQNQWVVTGGVANASGSWARARQLSPFNLAVGDNLRITADLSFAGTPGAADFYSLGIAKSNEDTGANMPQVEGLFNWQGSALSVGGATDMGYDSGDAVTVTMLFTREATANTWTLETMIDNTTDGTCFSGMTAPTDDPGTRSPETAWEWLDLGDPAYVGFRGLDNSGGVMISLASILIEKNVPGDDPMVLLGDVNGDGVISLLDVGPFVALITDNTFQVEADVNMDGVVNLLDVQPFVELLTGA
ncbi:MAG: dockerin type I domain-containing protein [Planctomycetota bacterium]